MKPVDFGGAPRWGRAARAAVVLLIVMSLTPRAALAQAISIATCGKVGVRQIQAGSQVLYSQCGNRFTAGQPYIALIIELTNVRGRTLVGTELLDPEQETILSFSRAVAPPTEQDIIYRKLWFWWVLPVGAEPGALASADQTFLFHMLSPKGKTARERPGEWTWKVSMNNGSPFVRKFTLEGAPGAPTPTPTPAPVASPEPTPTP